MKKVKLFLVAMVLMAMSQVAFASCGITKTGPAEFCVAAESGATYQWSVLGDLTIHSSSTESCVKVTGTTGTLIINRTNGTDHCCTSMTIDVTGEVPGLILGDGSGSGGDGSGSGGDSPPSDNCDPVTPIFHVQDPNWGLNGETCANEVLELSVLSGENCDDFVEYKWVIMGATLESQTADGRFAYIRTPANIGTHVYISVTGIYESGNSETVVQTGMVTCNGSGGQ